MVKKFLMGIALMLCGASAHAMGGTAGTYEVGYSSFASVGVRCTTGTVVQVNSSRPTGFKANIAGYRIQNQDSSSSVWLGGPSVSTTSVSAAQLAALGERVTAGADAVWHLAKDPSRSGVPTIPLYCRAADAAGVSGAILSVIWFGY